MARKCYYRHQEVPGNLGITDRLVQFQWQANTIPMGSRGLYKSEDLWPTLGECGQVPS